MAAVACASRGVGVRSTSTAKTLRLLTTCMDICQDADAKKNVLIFCFLIYRLLVPSFANDVAIDVAVVAYATVATATHTL